MPHTEDHKLFGQYKKELIRDLGRDALDEATINKVGRREFGPKWGGAVPNDRVKIRPGHFYVINTSGSKGRGVHWVGGYATSSAFYIYDSYDRPVKHLLPHLTRAIQKKGWTLGHTEHPMDQRGFTSETCGHDSIGFLMAVRDLGIRRAALL